MKEIDTKRCYMCDRTVPSKFISDMLLSGGYYDMCPRCALKLRNISASLPPNTKFKGTEARKLYDDYMEYLSKTEKGQRNNVLEEKQDEDNSGDKLDTSWK